VLAAFDPAQAGGRCANELHRVHSQRASYRKSAGMFSSSRQIRWISST
jgi:hypothetical protein